MMTNHHGGNEAISPKTCYLTKPSGSVISWNVTVRARGAKMLLQWWFCVGGNWVMVAETVMMWKYHDDFFSLGGHEESVMVPHNDADRNEV